MRRSARPTCRACPKNVARYLEPDQARLYELIWTRTVASQMESRGAGAHHGRYSWPKVGARKLDLRATGQVVRFDGFLKLYQEGKRRRGRRESPARLPPMARARRCKKDKIEASQHFTEPPPRYTEATLVKRMEELGIGRPSTYASTLAVLRDRDYVQAREEAADRRRTRAGWSPPFWRAFSAATSNMISPPTWKNSSTAFPTARSTGSRCCAISGAISPPPSAAPRNCARPQVLDSLNELLGPHIFPAKADGGDPRACPSCGSGPAFAEARQVRRLHRLLELSRMQDTPARCRRPGETAREGERPGVKVLGEDPATGAGDHPARRPVRRLCAAGRGREAEALVPAEDA